MCGNAMHKIDMASAADRSLDILGEPSKKALLLHLIHTFEIPLEGRCSISEIERALKQILGECALLVVTSINKQLRQEAS
jgi:hypothetical protein